MSKLEHTSPDADSQANRPASSGYDDHLDNLNLQLNSLNQASADARTFWLFYLALLTYLLVAIASVSHQDLLLNGPVHLPFLGINIDLEKFFGFAPIILLFVHFGIYQQHVLLAAKANKVNSDLTAREVAEGYSEGMHPMRLRVHSYFFTQIHCSPGRRGVFGAALHAMDQFSFVVFPIAIFLYFQIAFLPYHDPTMTNAHRVYLLADLFLIAYMQALIWRSKNEMKADAKKTPSIALFVRRGFWGVFTSVGSLLIVIFSVFVATFPGEWGDRQTSDLPGPLAISVPIDLEWARLCQRYLPDAAVGTCNFFLGEPKERLEVQTTGRRAFMPTAILFEGQVNFAAGALTSIFSRNLIVTDTELSVGSTEVSKPMAQEVGEGANREGMLTTQRVKVALRGRDLRFAVFDRSNLTGADFTASNLEGASLRGALLSHASMSCANKPLRSVIGGRFESCAKLYGARLEGSDLRWADLRGTCFIGAKLKSADLRGARLYKAQLQGADLTFARMTGVNLSEAKLQGARLLQAELQVASLRFATLQEDDPITMGNSFIDECRTHLPARIVKSLGRTLEPTDLSKANLELADLRLANLRNVKFSGAIMSGAELTLAQLQGADLVEVDLSGADLSFASLHGANVSSARLDGALLVSTRFDGAIMRSVVMRGADLSDAAVIGSDLRSADLTASNTQRSDLTAADLRCAVLPEGLAVDKPPPKLAADLARADVGVMAPSQVEAIADNAALLRSWRNKLRGKSPNERWRLYRTYAAPARRETRYDKRGASRSRNIEDVQVTSVANSPRIAQVAGQNRPACLAPGTDLDNEQIAQLVPLLVKRAICRDAPNAPYVAHGVVKRIVDSFGESLPFFPSDPAALIDGLEKAELSGAPNNSCIEEIDHGLIWQLTLAAKLHQGDREARNKP